jgi:uncharacterized protein YdaU (DUF1376 family)
VDKLPWFSFYVSDWLVGTVRLNATERGIYIDLLASQWDIGGLPGDDLPALARLARCDFAEMDAAWPKVSTKFERGEDGLWRNARLEDERASASASVESKRAGGKARATGAQRVAGQFAPAAGQQRTSSAPAAAGGQHQQRTSGAPGQSQSHVQRREERAPTLIAPYVDKRWAFVGGTFNVPASWETEAAMRSGGRITGAQFKAFYAHFAQWVMNERPDLSGNQLLRALDRELAKWREVQESKAEIEKGRKATRELMDFEARMRAEQKAGGAA